MQLQQGYWTLKDRFLDSVACQLSQLVLYFGSYTQLQNNIFYNDLKERYPNATIMGCSTGGEIFNDEISDDTCVYTAIKFESTVVRSVVYSEISKEDSYLIGQNIAKNLLGFPDLRGIFDFIRWSFY